MPGRQKERDAVYLKLDLTDKREGLTLTEILALCDTVNRPLAFGHPNMPGRFVYYNEVYYFEIDKRRDSPALMPSHISDNRWWMKQ